MVNLSQGVDELLEEQNKISQQIKEIRELQYKQLVSTLERLSNPQIH
jgi:hypothetical protein